MKKEKKTKEEVCTDWSDWAANKTCNGIAGSIPILGNVLSVVFCGLIETIFDLDEEDRCDKVEELLDGHSLETLQRHMCRFNGENKKEC